MFAELLNTPRTRKTSQIITTIDLGIQYAKYIDCIYQKKTGENQLLIK